MLAISGQARSVIAGAQVVGMAASMILGGLGAAISQERHDVDQAQAALVTANRVFNHRLARALAEGTPGEVLVPLARLEFQDWSVGYQRNFIVDRLIAADLRARTTQIAALAGTVDETENAVELDLVDRLGAAMDQLRQDVAGAHTAGVPDAGEYDTGSSAFSPWVESLAIPDECRARLAQVLALDNAVKAATAVKLAADQAAADAAATAAAAALQSARDNAAYQHDRAHVDLDQAVATGVLRVAPFAAAIAAIDSRQPPPQNAEDFNSVAADYASQARLLEVVLYLRQNTYNQLARARSLAARTAALGADVGPYVAQLNTAGTELNAAADADAILVVADAIRNINTALNAAYANALAHPPPPPGSVVLNVPFFAQIYSLSCEEAALQMALAYEGINQNQDAILGAIGVDTTPPQVDSNGNVVHWGDPYTNFVGDPNGYREGAQYGSRSGYGTYFTTIARVATGFGGHVLQANEGIHPQALYDAINAHHPSVVWVAWEYSPHPTTTYQAFDGRTVMYGAPWEHAVTLVGTSPGSVLINNPHGGQEWVNKVTFERAYQMFDQMAVTLN